MASPVSPEDQSATFVELFFDLVFVFSITQLVGLFHHHLDRVTFTQAILVFWLVWWAWTQFTWALNAADTNHHVVRAGTLVATAIAFFMAVALPDAFHGRAIWFAIPYVLVRAIGLSLYTWVARASCHQLRAVRAFTLLSSIGLAAVLAGGFIGGAMQYWLWGAAVLLDVAAAIAVGRLEGWNLHPAHFSERHGLFVIIALGETLIVAAGGLLGADWTIHLRVVVALAVALSCATWWIYFARIMPELEHALASTKGARQSMMARDVYSLNHFIILCGIVSYAVALEHILSHPADELTGSSRAALGLSVLLFNGGIVAAEWRATRRVLIPRLVLTLIAAPTLAFVPLSAAIALSFGLLTVLLIAITEQRTAVPASVEMAS